MLAHSVPLARIESNVTSSFLTSNRIFELVQQRRTHCMGASMLFIAAMDFAEGTREPDRISRRDDGEESRTLEGIMI